MNVTGRTRRTRTLSSAKGRTITITIVEPDRSDANIRTLQQQSHDWLGQAKALLRAQPREYDAYRRGVFAADVAWLAGSYLRQSRQHVLVAQTPTEILGAATYMEDPNGTWHLDLMSVSPQNQPGWPNADQIRGIGAEMLGEAVGEMVATHCGRIELEPLDDQARAYWTRRGFLPIGPREMKVECSGAERLAALLAHTEPDRPDQGDLVAADHEERRRGSAAAGVRVTARGEVVGSGTGTGS